MNPISPNINKQPKAPGFILLCKILTLKNFTSEIFHKTNPPSSLGTTDFGFNIPWASVLLVLEVSFPFAHPVKCHN